MNKFKYTKASSIEDATMLLGEDSFSKIIAGGTNLIDLMKYSVESPDRVIDITNLALSDIQKLDGGGLRLGALATNATTAYNQEVRSKYPLISEAILSGASAQLRNAATNGGNLLQRTRCYYFYDTATPCNKREPGSGCSAIEGFNRLHAILGASPACIATHPSDFCVALAALGATVNVVEDQKEYKIDFLHFHRLPGDEPQRDTNLNNGAIITSIDLPDIDFSKHYAYVKVRDRNSYAFAIVSCAAALQLEGDTITNVRVALGGVAHKPWRIPQVEESVKGKKATAETFEMIADNFLEGAKGYGNNDFKIPLAKKTIIRALQLAMNK